MHTKELCDQDGIRLSEESSIEPGLLSEPTLRFVSNCVCTKQIASTRHKAKTLYLSGG